MCAEGPAGVSIREATPDDRVAVARVLDGALLEVEGLGSRLEAGHVLLATAGTTVVGAIVLAPEGPADRSPPPGWPDATHVRAIAVRRRRRRNGIGSALVRAALEAWTPIVADFDAGLRPFYDALGAICEAGPDGRHWALVDAP